MVGLLMRFASTKARHSRKLLWAQYACIHEAAQQRLLGRIPCCLFPVFVRIELMALPAAFLLRVFIWRIAANQEKQLDEL